MNFPYIEGIRTTPKSMIECILKRALSMLNPITLLGSLERCSTAPKSGPKSHFSHPCKSQEIMWKMLFLKQFWEYLTYPQTSMVDFGPRNALNEKCPATFLVRNVMEITFRTCSRHLESIWGGPKSYTSAKKSAIFPVHLGSFYDFYEFYMHKSISDHPKINARMYI